MNDSELTATYQASYRSLSLLVEEIGRLRGDVDRLMRAIVGDQCSEEAEAHALASVDNSIAFLSAERAALSPHGRPDMTTADITRDQLDDCERAVTWIAWPGRRVYGPGLTREEAALQHDALLRSGHSPGGSYHAIRLAPESMPPAPWRECYQSVSAGVDPWGPTT